MDAPGPHGMSAAFFACSRGNAPKFATLSKTGFVKRFVRKGCLEKGLKLSSLRPKALKLSCKSFAKLGPRPMQEIRAAPGMECTTLCKPWTKFGGSVGDFFHKKEKILCVLWVCLCRKDVGRDDPRGAFGVGEALGDLQCAVDRGQSPGQESLVDS